MIEIVLAIDIGGTFTKIGLVDKKGVIVASTMFKTEAKKPFHSFKILLKQEIRKLLSPLEPRHKILAVGIGAPNANYKTGVMEKPPNFNWGETVPIQNVVLGILNKPTFMTNDANASALGELYFGTAKKMKNFVVLTLGTGLGSGIINDGKLILGQYGMAGELGHVNVTPNGRQCNCGLKGCLETYASVTGIKRTVFELFAKSNADSILRSYSFNHLTGEEISAAALKGDTIALDAFHKTAEILGKKMADTVAHIEPEAFIITGGLSKAGDLFLKPLIANMENSLFNSYKGKVKVLISKNSRKDAILGPAALALQELKINVRY